MRHSKLLGLGLAFSMLVACDLDFDIDLDEWDTTTSGGGDWGGAQAPVTGDGFLGYKSGMTGFDVHGVYVPAGRAWGVAGMSGMTCQVYEDDASFGTDVDMTNGNDTVEDGMEDEEGNTVIIVTDGAEQITPVRMPEGESVTSVMVPGHIASQNTFDGWISLSDDNGETDGGCKVEWYTLNGSDIKDVELDDAFCDDAGRNDHSFDFDVTGDVAWVGSHIGTAIVTTHGTDVSEVPSDFVAWDPSTNLTYTATRGGTIVTAVLPDGSPHWTTDVSRRIFGLDDMGPDGRVAVSVERVDGYSDIVVLDGATGDILTTQAVEREPGEVVVSDDGDTLVLPSPTGFDYFQVGYVPGGDQ